jgi:hypothetical protein
MRNPRSKPANARPRPVPPGAARARKSSTSTNAKPLCATSPRGTPSARRSSTAAPPKDGIEPFDQLIDQFMSQHPYRRAQRVFLIIDSGSAHRGKRSIDCLQGTWKNMTVVHTPVHASWLNQPKSTSPSSNAKSSTQRLRRPRHPPTIATGLRPTLRTNRCTVPMEVHPPGPPQAPGQNRHPARLPSRLTLAARYVRELPSQTT